MKIPNKIQIAGKIIDIVFDNKRCDDIHSYAEARYREGIILMQNKVDGIQRKQDFINESFIHESLHWICNILGYDNLRNDEDKIGCLSELLYQVIKQIEVK